MLIQVELHTTSISKFTSYHEYISKCCHWILLQILIWRHRHRQAMHLFGNAYSLSFSWSFVGRGRIDTFLLKVSSFWIKWEECNKISSFPYLVVNINSYEQYYEIDAVPPMDPNSYDRSYGPSKQIPKHSSGQPTLRPQDKTGDGDWLEQSSCDVPRPLCNIILQGLRLRHKQWSLYGRKGSESRVRILQD